VKISFVPVKKEGTEEAGIAADKQSDFLKEL
jgi:hypothetical protein